MAGFEESLRPQLLVPPLKQSCDYEGGSLKKAWQISNGGT